MPVLIGDIAVLPGRSIISEARQREWTWTRIADRDQRLESSGTIVLHVWSTIKESLCFQGWPLFLKRGLGPSIGTKISIDERRSKVGIAHIDRTYQKLTVSGCVARLEILGKRSTMNPEVLSIIVYKETDSSQLSLRSVRSVVPENEALHHLIVPDLTHALKLQPCS